MAGKKYFFWLRYGNIYFFVLVFCVAFFGMAFSAQSDFFEGRVDTVIAGDKIILHGGTVVYLAGIVAPNPQTLSTNNTAIVALAQKAKKETTRLVKGKTIRLEFVEETGRIADASRTAYVFAGGVFLNAYLVKNGLAVISDTIGSEDKYFKYLMGIQVQAQADKKGVWQYVS